MFVIPALVALAAAAPLPAQVQNPDFATDTNGWLFHVTQGGQLDWDATRGDPAAGSAHVGNVWTSARYDAWSQCVALLPGAYDLEAQVASSVQTGNACELRVVVVDQPDCNIAANILVDQRVTTTRNDAVFETLAATGVAPPQAGAAAIYLGHRRADGAAPGDSDCWFDHVGFAGDLVFAGSFEP
jgi:hypothetical protein